MEIAVMRWPTRAQGSDNQGNVSKFKDSLEERLSIILPSMYRSQIIMSRNPAYAHCSFANF
jgi:hypothetical protein